MAKRRARDIQVGAIFALALIILAITVMALGGESRLFSPQRDYQVTFANADGLTVGSPVKMSGVSIGAVRTIRLSTDPGVSGIEVQFGVDPEYVERIRRDSRAALRISSSFLTGEKFVEVIPGSPDQPPLPPGSVMESLQPPELMAQAAATAENLNQITVSLQKILSDLEAGEGLLGQMIRDPEFGKEGLEALKGTFANLEGLTADIRRGRGFVGRMIYDKDVAGILDDLAATVKRIGSLVESIDPSRGAVGALLEEGGAAEQAIEDLAAAAGSLRRMTANLEAPEGLIGRLVNDSEYSEGVAADLRATLANTAEITDKINRGEGTLGALVNDRTLYDGMEDLAAGVNDSKFARWLTRHYRKRGIKLETRELVDAAEEENE